MNLTITEAANTRLKQFINNNSESIGIRIDIVTKGCSGQSFDLKLASEFSSQDLTETIDGITIGCSVDHLSVVEGTTIDWQQTPIGAGFVFTTPAATNSCGCGKSFCCK